MAWRALSGAPRTREYSERPPNPAVLSPVSYRADPSQPLSDELLRALRAELDETLVCVADTRNAPGQRVRRARKGTKRLRALLRLIGGPAGAVYRREYGWIRESARQLSDLRDADAVVETTDLLANCCRTKSQQRAMEPLRRHLQQARSAAASSGHAERQLARFVERLTETQTRLAETSLPPTNFELIEEGLAACYGTARRRFRKAYENPSPASFHDCRKAAKRLGFVLAFLRCAWPDQMKALRSTLREMNGLLGQHQDFVLLLAAVKARTAPVPTGVKSDLAETIAERLTSLREEARPLGQRIFAWKPRAFARAMAAWWGSAAGPRPAPA